MTNAATISRILREGGLRPLPSGTSRMREGIRVSKSFGGEVRISFDFDSNRCARELRAVAEEILKAHLYNVYTPDDGQYGDVISLKVAKEQS